MAAAVRGGDVAGVIFHTDKGGEYLGDLFARACQPLRGDPVDGPGRLGAGQRRRRGFNSTLEHELLSRRRFATKDEARRAVAGWIDGFYNRIRRHSTTGRRSPIDYELAAATAATAA